MTTKRINDKILLIDLLKLNITYSRNTKESTKVILSDECEPTHKVNWLAMWGILIEVVIYTS